MQAGFFRWKKAPLKTRMLNAICCKNFGIELIFFGPEDVNMKTGTVNGEILINNKWVRKTVPIPKIINNSPYKSRNVELHEYLDRNSHFMFKPFGGKRKEYNFFKKEGSLEHLLIPSVRIKNISHVKEFLQKYEKAIFKPLHSDKGKGIFLLELIVDEFIFKDGKNTKVISENEFNNFYNENIKGQGLLMSMYIESKTKAGHPFDIRVNLEKNEKGKWEIAQNYVRIGINNSITSNVDRGGGVIKTNNFLKNEFNKEKSTRIREEIKNIYTKLPKVVERMVDFEINSIGLDLGIDSDGKLYMFEINSYPGSSFAVGQVAYLRAGYMNYYLTNTAVKEKIEVRA